MTPQIVGTYDAPRHLLHTLLAEARIVGYDIIPDLATGCQRVVVDPSYDEGFLVALDELLYTAVR